MPHSNYKSHKGGHYCRKDIFYNTLHCLAKRYQQRRFSVNFAPLNIVCQTENGKSAN